MSNITFESWFHEMSNKTKALELLAQIVSFNGHTDGYQFLTDSKTAELFQQARELIAENKVK
jgi:hypothetical protein